MSFENSQHAELSSLTALSPLDGRYRAKITDVAEYFSEKSLFKYRLLVEVEYFLALWRLVPDQMGFGERLPASVSYAAYAPKLRAIYESFSSQDCQKIKDLERVTNHDVKAVEYFLKERLPEALRPVSEFIHFGLTSQDINNTAVPLSIKQFVEEVYVPALHQCLVEPLRRLGTEWADVPMLARTHGQPATPTRLGKELLVFVERVERQLALLRAVPWTCKFGGATGGFNAHAVACPAVDWARFADQFAQSERLGLRRQQLTTQIEHYDGLAALFDAIKRINTVLIDLSRDVWQYISLEYFRQRTVATETGSSTMPHKVNPIDFENAEGNFGLANCLLAHFAAKLPISRLQRDLSDSTVLRNVGVPLGHTMVALRSLRKGLGKLLLNRAAIDADLNRNWAVLAEPIQTVLRLIGYPNPYEALKKLTRPSGGGQDGTAAAHVTQDTLAQFIGSLSAAALPEPLKQQLLALTPASYIGYSVDRLVDAECRATFINRPEADNDDAETLGPAPDSNKKRKTH